MPQKINYGVQKLLFVYAAKEHLINNGFEYVDKYCLNTDENPYALVNEDIYTLSEWIDGRECSFYDTSDLVKASKTLAKCMNVQKDMNRRKTVNLKVILEDGPILWKRELKL